MPFSPIFASPPPAPAPHVLRTQQRLYCRDNDVTPVDTFKWTDFIIQLERKKTPGNFLFSIKLRRCIFICTQWKIYVISATGNVRAPISFPLGKYEKWQIYFQLKCPRNHPSNCHLSFVPRFESILQTNAWFILKILVEELNLELNW